LLNAWVNESGSLSNTIGINNSLAKIKPDVCLLGHFQELWHDWPLKYCSVNNGDPPPNSYILAWGERYHYEDTTNDTIGPNRVVDLRYQISQDSIFLTWEMPVTAEDGENAIFYRVVKDSVEDVFLTGMQYSANWESIRSYNFRIYSYDHCGNQSRNFAEVDVDLSNVLSYQPHSNPASSLKIYPIPADKILLIETKQTGYFSIEITSLNGQLLYTDKMEGPTHEIDLSSFDKGLYFITVWSRDYVRTEKIIKQ
jgi:hypothetical protein